MQAALDGWLAERAPAEKVTGIAAYVSFAAPGPAIEAFAGKTGRAPDDPPVGRDTLFAMGSTSKSFAAAVILKLEAEGLLSLDDTVGEWLPAVPRLGRRQHPPPAQHDQRHPQLLRDRGHVARSGSRSPRATSPPRSWWRSPTRPASNDLPVTTGYHYSNTNYILAGMIAAKAAGKPYPDAGART